MTTSVSTQSLWDFALAFYAQPQVAETCLQLQDEYQANVCLIIGLRWLDACAQPLDDDQFNSLSEYIRTWTDTVIVPLRSLRRALKFPVGNLVLDDAQEQVRIAIKNAELLAEKKLLMEIERWANSQKKVAQKNLAPVKTSQIKSAQGTANLERYLLQLNALKYVSALQ